MFSMKLFFFLFIVQKVLSAPDYDYISVWYGPPESTESKENEEEIAGPILYEDISCSEKDQSSISNSDLKYFIEDMATKLQLEESLINSYHPEAVEIHDKYLAELEDFRHQLEDRPEHMLHILEDMANLRQRLDPKVQEIAVILQDFDIHEEKHNNIAERADTMLKQLEKYKKICQINCEDSDIAARFGHKTDFNNLILNKYNSNNNRICIRIKDLNEYIIAKLSQFQEEYNQELLCEINEKDNMYDKKLNYFKIDLKEAAVKQFGMTMYDILSLQDDYHHFVNDLKNINIASELDNIQENSAEMKLRLVSLKRDVEEYRQYCMNCNSDRRVKRNIIRESWGMQSEEYSNNSSDIINELLNAKIDEIKGIIQNNFTAMFEELDEDFDDEFIDSYITKLQPIQNGIETAIQMEQEAFYELQRNIPESSIMKILELSRTSAEIVQALDSAKQYIDHFI